MSEVINTFTKYLGPEFQQNLMWQLLVEPEFCDKTINNLSIDYFDDPLLKRLFIFIKEYYKEYEKVPNLQNDTIIFAINKYKAPNNIIEEESLFAIVQKIRTLNDKVNNGEVLHSGDAIQKETNFFIKQQEYRGLGEFILDKSKSGDIKNKYIITEIEERIEKIVHIGDEEDYGVDVFDNIESIFDHDFRETIPTGINVIDAVTGGGLGKGEVGLILAPGGVGKAQPLNSKILTPNGWTTMGNIKVDDLVIGSDGKSQKVLGVYPQGMRPIYKIEFNDQTSVLCDKEHLWSVNSSKQRLYATRKNNKKLKIPDYTYVTKTTDVIMNSLISRRRKNSLNYKIPIISPVEFNYNKVELNPYLLGVLIGDGSLINNSIKFTSIDEDIVNNVKSIINIDFKNLTVKQISDTISYGITGKKGIKNNLNIIIKNFGLNVISNKKFIPNEYKISSINNRISLLQGLMDTDGYASKSGRTQYSTTSIQLANDIKEIVLSLGGFCTIREKMPTYIYKGIKKIGKKSYTLTISFSDKNIKLFSLERKQSRVIYRDKYKNNKYIKSITYSHEEEAQCIYVENSDHLYVTDDYILTHNTTILTKIANSAHAEGKKVLQIILEDTPKQIQRKHSTIWSNIKLSELEDKKDEVIVKVLKRHSEIKNGGKLLIKQFSQEDTTMMDIRKWIIKYQKKIGYKFDVVILDYLDCINPHKKSFDKNEAELIVVKSFLALASDFDIPCWSAIQGNRGSYAADFLNVNDMGGSIKRYQKAHFFMSVAKPEEQKDTNLANFRILKARFAQDGQSFKDSILDNDKMEIILNDNNYGGKYTNALPKLSEEKKSKIDQTAMELRMLEDAQKSMGISSSSSVFVITNNNVVPADQITSETVGDYKRSKYQAEPDPEPEIIAPPVISDTIKPVEAINDVPEVEIIERPTTTVYELLDFEFETSTTESSNILTNFDELTDSD